jgi:broad specificity phosphatase PhoE
VERLIVCRHAESVFNVDGVINGDPSVPGGLSARGRRQAKELGGLLSSRPLDLCVTTEFERTIETADIALAGRRVPRLVMPELSDAPLGVFELRPFEEFAAWRRAHGPEVELPGTEVNERNWLGRIRGAFDALARRPEGSILAILHGACVSWLLASAERPATAPHAEPTDLSRDELLAALAITRDDVYARWHPTPAADP